LLKKAFKGNNEAIQRCRKKPYKFGVAELTEGEWSPVLKATET
jgi:hypothetical protein